MASATALKAIRGQIQNIHFMHQLIMHSLSYLISLHFEYDVKKKLRELKIVFIFLPIIPNLANINEIV